MSIDKSLRIEAQKAPFSIPTELRTFLEESPLEMGTGGGIGDNLDATHFWIAFVDNSPAGYCWLKEGSGFRGDGLHSSIAVLPAHQGQSIGTLLKDWVENCLRIAGVQELFAQVNSSTPKSGLRVRRWLVKRGYHLNRDHEYFKSYSRLSDEQLLEEAIPLFFRKTLART